ncbi:MAG: DUF3298 domain-containing protein [Candidatus Margulisiibacteriota bacterium]
MPLRKFILGSMLLCFYVIVSAVAAVAIPTIESQVITERMPERYSIEVSVPLIKGLKNTAIQNKVNSAIKKALMNEIASFKKEEKAKTISIESCLAIDNSVVGISSKYVSLYCSVMYFVAGAHPSHWIIPFNYNLETGKTIQLRDLFRGKKNYLQSLVSLSKQKLVEQEIKTDEWVNRGIQPNDKSFQYFTFNQEKLRIIFGEYQICAYVSGMPDVEITWNELGVKFPY